MNRLALFAALGLASTASAQMPGGGSGMPGPGSGSGMPPGPGPGSGSGMPPPTMPIDTLPGGGSGMPPTTPTDTLPGPGSGSSSWCGDGQRTGSEACDDGMWNGQPGYCNATCSAVIRRTPFANPDDAPVLQPLTHGRVLASRQYEAELPLGELPGVGRAPGFSLAIRLRSDGAAGACGPACTLQATTAVQAAGGYVITEAGVARRFEPVAGSWREVAAGSPITPATAALVGGDLVVSEADGQLTRTFDSAGRERSRSTPWGAVTLGYDGAGRLTSATNAAGAALTAAYDASGRLATVTDPTGFAITVRYSGDGHAISLEGPADGPVTPNLAIGWMANEITSLGRLGFAAETISYDRGLVSFARGVDGSAYAFDSNATQIVVADATLQYRRMTYDANQNVSVIETNAGAQTSYVRDGLGRVTSTHYATGSGELVESVAYDASGRMTSTTDTRGGVTQMTYDAAGNLTSTTAPDGSTTSFAYAGGRLVSTTDPLGRVTSKTYDANGLETSTTSLGVTLSATYTARGQVATATDARGVTTTFAYDGLGRLVSQAQPGTPTVTITRTPAGAGQQVVIARGSETRTVLTDRYDRVVSESSSQGDAASYTYDPITGLRAETSATFRGKTQTSRRTYTNTGDTAQMWVNGQQRQAAARIVPPGNAWIQP